MAATRCGWVEMAASERYSIHRRILLCRHVSFGHAPPVQTLASPAIEPTPQQRHCFQHCARHLYPVPASPGQGLAVGRGTGNPPRTRLIVGMYVPGFALTACCLSNDTPLLSTAQPFSRWQRAESRQFSDRRRVMRCLSSQKYTHRNPLCPSSLATWVLAWASNTGLLEA
jgi:hypothetical protein